MSLLKRKFRSIKNGARVWFLKVYLAGKYDENEVLIIASSPRSGSTLLGEVMGRLDGAAGLFEPLHLLHVPAAQRAGFITRTYVRPNAEWPEGEAFLRSVFKGDVVNSWTSRDMTVAHAFKSRFLIVKFVRATRLLPWLCTQFPLRPPVLLIRHPCAVVASQLRYGWENTPRPEEPDFLDEFPEFRAALQKTETVEEFLAAQWALDQLPALMAPAPHAWVTVTYEALLAQPRAVLGKILNAWGKSADIDTLIAGLMVPSSVVSSSGMSGTAGWKKQLSESQVSKILKVVESFGITFYTEAPEPDEALLYSPSIAENIKKAGRGSK